MGTSFQPGGRAPAPPPLDLVQDFVNTEIPDWNRDDIATPEALETWLQGHRLLAAGETVDADAFVTARALRSTLRELALANTLGERPPAGRQAAIDGMLESFPLVLRLAGPAPGLTPVPTAASLSLARLVAIVAEAQLGGSWERMKACRQETCGWVFYDSSRNRSSSWCSMQICGGREKARAYRRKRAASAP